MNDNAIVVRPDGEAIALDRPMDASQVLARVRAVNDIIDNVLIKNVDYGRIPGCGDKDALFQSGAEKLGMAFRLIPSYKIEVRELSGGHREYTSTCTLSSPAGDIVGQGVGSCSTMEKKYRYRNAERSCPECGEATIYKSKKDGGWFCWSKKGGCGAKFEDGNPEITEQEAGKTENPDIADQFNTALKMAEKRSFIKGVLTCTAAGGRLTQGDDDPPKNKQPRPPIVAPVETPPPPADGKERITKEQAHALWKILTACRGKNAEEQWRAKLADHKLESTNHLPAAEYEAALKWIRGEQGPEDKW